MSKNITLDQSLQAYRVMNTPTKFSWKQHWAQETFSNRDLFSCEDYERRQFSKRLKECQVTIAPHIKTKPGDKLDICTLEDLVKIIVDPNNKDIVKSNRKVIYSTANGERPVGNSAYDNWNGFQIIDLDIKNESIAKKLKRIIFNKLYKCNWFLGTTLSSSGMGIHVYTKITVPQDDDVDRKKRKLLYLTNFRHKFSFVYLVCISSLEEIGCTKDDILKWMDISMFRPQQGGYIGYDQRPLINTGFFEDFIYVNFDNVEDIGHPDIDWVAHPDLKEIFKRWEYFEDDEGESLEVNVLDKPEPMFNMHNKVHYKHFERWRLANTLVNLYGKIKGYQYLRQICSNNIKIKSFRQTVRQQLCTKNLLMYGLLID